MRHGVKKYKLGRDNKHRRAMLRNLATSVLKQGLESDPMDRQVRTTVQKAKAVRGLVDRLITYAKKGDLSARRQAARFVPEKEHDVLRRLFSELGDRYKDRQGGYTRILKVSGNRHGDNAEMAIITLVEDEVTPKVKKKKKSSEKASTGKIDITKKKADAVAEEPVAENTEAPSEDNDSAEK